MIFYPDGYGTAKLSLDHMRLKHGGKMHPEFARRFFAYMEYKGGVLGVGGGWRSTQPDRPGFAPDGKSFHQDQRFASGFVGYAAVDLVHVNPGNVHRSPTWEECADAPAYGLHTFISGEPWHIQCIEMRGWQTWVDAGRPDPQVYSLPGTVVPPVVPPPPSERMVDMFIVIVTNGPDTSVKETWLLCDGTQLSHIVDGHYAALVQRVPGVPQVRPQTAEETVGLIRSSRTMTPCPPEWVNTVWGALWTSSRG